VDDSQKFVETAFALDTMAVSDVQDLQDGFYLIQPLENRPSEIPAFDEVKERVVQDVRAEKQWAQAESDARTMLQTLRDGKTFVDAGQAVGLTPKATGEFKRNEAVPGIGYAPALAAAVFKLTSENPYPEAPVRSEQGVFVFRLLERRLPDAQSGLAELDAIRRQLLQRKQGEIYQNWMAQARSQTEIEIDHAMLN
jgi:parvulin-like peptidyl-prolyl isomerase